MIIPVYVIDVPQLKPVNRATGTGSRDLFGRQMLQGDVNFTQMACNDQKTCEQVA